MLRIKTALFVSLAIVMTVVTTGTAFADPQVEPGPVHPDPDQETTYRSNSRTELPPSSHVVPGHMVHPGSIPHPWPPPPPVTPAQEIGPHYVPPPNPAVKRAVNIVREAVHIDRHITAPLANVVSAAVNNPGAVGQVYSDVAAAAAQTTDPAAAIASASMAGSALCGARCGAAAAFGVVIAVYVAPQLIDQDE